MGKAGRRSGHELCMSTPINLTVRETIYEHNFINENSYFMFGWFFLIPKKTLFSFEIRAKVKNIAGGKNEFIY